MFLSMILFGFCFCHVFKLRSFNSQLHSALRVVFLPCLWSGDRKILPAHGTNQILGSSGYRPLTIKEINKPKFLTVLKIRDSKKALARSSVFLKLVLNLVQVRATGQSLFFYFY